MHFFVRTPLLRPVLLRSSFSKRTMSTHNHLSDDCIFCKIIKGNIPSMKLVETDKTFSFMDIDPLSEGHMLVIPKYHAEFFHQVPDEYLADALPVAKKIAAAAKLDQYNVLQNNGKLANQAVPHVHFHVIPKPNEETGLGVRWKPIKPSQDALKAKYEEVKGNL
ncbi:HIT domain protein [Syncephalastrum racemosum]|uniref:HIT domain protein n=1 Tax=Syncephalastrum racemosum TaxID=13706 RepID=A0A1X2HAP1_SYNRA|nr:HIT domain protein [Syncephalastrum racemosum]